MKHIVFLGVGANKQKSAGWTNSHYATVVWMHKDAEETIKSGTLRKKKKRSFQSTSFNSDTER
jgi:hypothetical protein